MPNWITNKVQAPEHVIRAMLNADGEVDFNNAAPFTGPNNWNGISLDAEEAAEVACGLPVSDNPMLAMLQADSRKRINIRGMSEESFKQFIGMLENYRACGYLHSMQFAGEVWGTKWNACDPKAEPEHGRCEFETAWACPIGVFEKVSQRFPDDAITVTYADEDIGSNCGTFTMKAGQVVEEDIAPSWSDQSEADKSKWKAFARQVTGLEPCEEED